MNYNNALNCTNGDFYAEWNLDGSMEKPLESLERLLSEYHALAHHSDELLRARLVQLQQWQKQRIYQANPALLADPKTAAMARFVLDKVYDVRTIDALSHQLATALANARAGTGRLQKLAPQAAMAVGVRAVAAAMQAVRLDLPIAQKLTAESLNDHAYRQAFAAVSDLQTRRTQLYELVGVCRDCEDKFNNFLLKNSFKLAKSRAYKHGYQMLYDFIASGFAAMSDGDTEAFCQSFLAAELEQMQQLHQSTMP